VSEWTTAIHEAAHVAVCWALRFEPIGATIVPSGRCLGRTWFDVGESDSLVHLAAVALAGRVAESVLEGGFEKARINWFASRDPDVEAAVRLLERERDPLFARRISEGSARLNLVSRWNFVEAVAEELFRLGEIGGERKFLERGRVDPTRRLAVVGDSRRGTSPDRRPKGST
jgi:hypothetical protein